MHTYCAKADSHGHYDACLEVGSSLENGHASIMNVHSPERGWWQRQGCAQKGPHHGLVSDNEVTGARRF